MADNILVVILIGIVVVAGVYALLWENGYFDKKKKKDKKKTEK